MLAEERWPEEFEDAMAEGDGIGWCTAQFDAEEDWKAKIIEIHAAAKASCDADDDCTWDEPVTETDEDGNETTIEATSSPVDGILYPWDQVDDNYTQKAVHFTFVFQIFVFMQVFNQINARKLGNALTNDPEFNVFSGVFKNLAFVGITVVTFGVQMLMVEYGGRPMKAYPLHLKDNLYCFLPGVGELIWGVFLKFLPLKLFQCLSMDEKPMSEEEAGRSLTALAKQSTVKKSKSKTPKKSAPPG